MSLKDQPRPRLQCDNCPWKKGADLGSIPGYSVEYHRRLDETAIADPEKLESILSGPQSVMICHKTEGEYCAGWAHNQVNQGNNLGLRLRVRQQGWQFEVTGPQHETFQDTLPPDA